MKAILSPAKTLDLKAAWPPEIPLEKPILEKQAETLMVNLRELSPIQIEKLMKISPPLAALNHERFHNWKPANLKEVSSGERSDLLPAVYLFRGDVYQGIDPTSLTPAQIKKMNDFTYILSGLYGLLRPLTVIRPYRLEMGTPLSNSKGKDLYAFWGNTIAAVINRELSNDKNPVLVNLASEEYYSAVKSHLSPTLTIIHPVFLDRVKGKYKIVSFYAKKARGLMVRFMTGIPLQSKNLKQFNLEGYHFSQTETDLWQEKKFSQSTNQYPLVFLREH